MIFIPAVLPVLLFQPAQAQNNPWRFTERVGLDRLIAPLGDKNAAPGLDFDLAVSYRLEKHWQTFLLGSCNDFPEWQRSGANVSAQIGSLLLGLRHEQSVSKKINWGLGGGAGIAKAEFFEQEKLADPGTGMSYCLEGESTVSAVLLEGFELGVFFKLQSYFPESLTGPMAGKAHAGAGISLRWWWW